MSTEPVDFIQGIMSWVVMPLLGLVLWGYKKRDERLDEVEKRLATVETSVEVIKSRLDNIHDSIDRVERSVEKVDHSVATVVKLIKQK